MDDSRCVHLDEDRRAADPVAGPQLGAIININRSEAAVEIGAMLLDNGVGRIGPLFGELRQADLLYRPHPDRAQVDQFHRLIELEAVNALVRQAKAPGKVDERSTT